VVLLAAMFISFIIQIFMRYAAGNPVGWTLEVCLLTYLWLVFWASSFVIRKKNHVTFDLLYSYVKPKTRRLFDIITGTIIILAFAISYPATVKFVTFMKIETTSVTGIRLDLVFLIYLIFMTAVLISGGIELFRLFRNHSTKSDSVE
jgi:TRAP-type C4-dicarboxylate transport system permease small subunit